MEVARSHRCTTPADRPVFDARGKSRSLPARRGGPLPRAGGGEGRGSDREGREEKRHAAQALSNFPVAFRAGMPLAHQRKSRKCVYIPNVRATNMRSPDIANPIVEKAPTSLCRTFPGYRRTARN